MQVSSKKLPRGQAEVTVVLTVAEYQPFLQQTAAGISMRLSIPGFRPGKAPYSIVVEKIGEGKLWEEALEPAVKRTYAKAMTESKFITIGSPQIAILTIAPGNPISYRATVNLLPDVELPELEKISITRKKVEVTDAEVESTLDDIRKMRRTEKLVDRPAVANDKVEVKLQTFQENVPVENGQVEKLPLVLGEKKFLPEVEQHIIGLKAGQDSAFTVKLPTDYHNRTVAGKTVEFRIKILGVYELTLPEVNDDFAKSVGHFTSVTDLREKVKASLMHDASKREDERLENEIIEAIINKSKFTDIPDLLVTTETKNMLAELEQQISRQEVSFDDYLTHLKKTRAELLLDFTPTAMKRVKGALVTRAVAKQQKTEINENEIDAIIQQEFADQGDDPKLTERTKNPAFRAHIQNILASRKVMEYLKATVVK